MVKVKVLYKSPRGVMSFDRRKPIFLHKGYKKHLEVGLGIIDMDSFIDKGEYAFANITNVEGVLDIAHFNIELYENVGVPQTILKGVYGNSVFIKEVYKDNAIIKALDKDGSVLIRETRKTKNNAINTYFCRLDNVLSDWEDITDVVLASIIKSIKDKKSELNIANPYILYALKRLIKNKVVKYDNGVIVAEGKHEHLIIWGEGNKSSMAWFGRPIKGIGTSIDITHDIKNFMVENGI